MVGPRDGSRRRSARPHPRRGKEREQEEELRRSGVRAARDRVSGGDGESAARASVAESASHASSAAVASRVATSTAGAPDSSDVGREPVPRIHSEAGRSTVTPRGAMARPSRADTALEPEGCAPPVEDHDVAIVSAAASSARTRNPRDAARTVDRRIER